MFASLKQKKSPRKGVEQIKKRDFLLYLDTIWTRFKPTLIIHGDKDPMVGQYLAQEILDELSENGTEVIYKALPNGKHNLPGFRNVSFNEIRS